MEVNLGIGGRVGDEIIMLIDHDRRSMYSYSVKR